MSEFLSVKDVAIRLGVSHDTINRMINNGKIQTVIIGKRAKIKSEEVDKITTGRNEKIIFILTKLIEEGFSQNDSAKIIKILGEII